MKKIVLGAIMAALIASGANANENLFVGVEGGFMHQSVTPPDELSKAIGEVLDENFDEEIKIFLINQQDCKNLKNLFTNLDTFINNIAHTNSGKPIQNPSKTSNDLISSFEKYVIKAV